MLEKTEKISTGSHDLNKWLYGGYEKDIVTMIAGPPGSGKTNFCMLVSCSQAKKGKKVIFIDTEGGFSVERIKQMLSSEADGTFEEISKNILLLSPANFLEQQESFSQLMKKIKKEQNIGVVVIDGMVTLYRLEIGEASRNSNELKIKEINWRMAEQMKTLSEISRKQKVPVIITNQVYSEFLSEEELRQGVKKETNLVGGDLLKYWSKCIIELKLEGRKRKAIILKHRNIPQREMNFEIKDSGIFKKGWI
ncbi:DNA repair and recombination protein RadB [Candidatus Pacearchaeota archaeon]|nr:DNA repair and recombination protein RadB [Candidatus Pacearchaeota archaeon]